MTDLELPHFGPASTDALADAAGEPRRSLTHWPDGTPIGDEPPDGSGADNLADALDSVPAEERNSWAPIDLGPYLRGEIPEVVPTLGVARSDGVRLLYPGLEHAVIGEMECGKSWLVCAFAWAEITNRRHVLYVHFEEDSPADTIGRLVSLGATAEHILTYFHFVGPTRGITADDLLALLGLHPSVVVLDGVNEGMSLHGMAIREEDGAASFRRRVVKPFARSGAAVVSCDHVVKDKETRGRYALGSIHKGNAINGALFLLENAEPFGRGMRGRSHLFVTKDRPGHLRRHGKATRLPGKTLLAELVVDDTLDDWLELHLFAIGDGKAELAEQPPAPDAVVDELLCSRVMQVIRAHGGELESARAVGAALREAGHGVRDARYRKALDDLVLAGQLEELKNGSKTVYIDTGSASHDQSE